MRGKTLQEAMSTNPNEESPSGSTDENLNKEDLTGQVTQNSTDVIDNVVESDRSLNSEAESEFPSEEELREEFTKKVLRQGPWIHPYPLIVTISLIGLILSLVLGSFIVDRYYNRFFTPNFYSAPPDLETLIEEVQKSTVIVTCGNAQGSGWAIDLGPVTEDAAPELKLRDKLYPYSVITNHHVISDCVNNPKAVKVTNGLNNYESILFTYDKDNDLAIVSTKFKITPLSLSMKPKPGWWSMALGSPFGLEKSVSTGNVMNSTDKGYIISSAPVNPGNSGGPLVNSYGEVMGTNTFYLRGFQSVNVALELDLLCKNLVKCSGSLNPAIKLDECNWWCEAKQWATEVRDFVSRQ